jgi:hypothetical protein
MDNLEKPLEGRVTLVESGVNMSHLDREPFTFTSL